MIIVFLFNYYFFYDIANANYIYTRHFCIVFF